MTAVYDVAVLGGGPAGSSVARTLARFGRSVVLFESSDYKTPRIGETVGAETGPLLDELGLANPAGVPHQPCHFVRSAWGDPEPVERSSMVHHRSKFDEWLSDSAGKAGAARLTNCGSCLVDRRSNGFEVLPARGEAATARWLVDATGRGALRGTKALGNRTWLKWDRLLAVVGRLCPEQGQPIESCLLLEAVQDGWWYSVPQPGGDIVFAFLTDSDLWTGRGREALEKRWQMALQRTTHTGSRANNARLIGPVRAVRADSGILLPNHGDHWIAVGDASMACDPLGGNGVARALRSGIAAANAVHRALEGEHFQPLNTLAMFNQYLDRRARYYLSENRWPSAPFWARRRPPEWRTEPVTLEPEAMLHWDGSLPGDTSLTILEALLPHQVIQEFLQSLRISQPAHAALTKLQSLAPLDARRLLVALQILVERLALIVSGSNH